MTLIYLPLLVIFVTTIDTTGRPCPTGENLPVVNICKADTKLQGDSSSVLIEADTMQNCSCELAVINQNDAVKVNMQKFDQKKSSSPSAFGCGLLLHFVIGEDIIWEASCIINTPVISNSIKQNGKMIIMSLTVTGTLKDNEGYCIEIKKDISDKSGNQLELTCGIDSTSTMETTQSSEKTKRMTQTTNPKTTTMTTKTTMPKSTTITTVPVTTPPPTTIPATITTTVPTTNIITSTSTITTTSIDTNEIAITNFTSTDSSVTTSKANQLENKDNDDTTVLAAGVSVGGIVVIIVVTVVVCIYRRNHPKSASKATSKPDRAVNNDIDDYGLRENVLYVPAESTPVQTNNNLQNAKRISVDIDGNYSTVNLDIVPLVEESTGDNSSIDMVKEAPTASNMNGFTNEKPIIAPKPKQKVTIQDDVYSVPDKKRLKHVTAPGDNGCEYAVVSKPNKANVDKSEDQPSMSNAYAAVEKKKRMSDGKGTNQKRDSSTAENDGETAQS